MDKIDVAAIRKFDSLELLAKQVVEGFVTGLHKSPFHGFSVEFSEHRLYNKGESTKHIDWKLYGRTDKLFVKRFEEETNLRCQFVIDSSSSMYYPQEENTLSKQEYSVHLAAALMQLLKRQRDAVGLSIFSDKLDVHTPAKSSIVHQKMIYQHLENLLNEPKEAKQSNITETLHIIADSIPKRSMVVIMSDMMETGNNEQIESLFGALQHLKHNKHEVMLFHTSDKKTELDFEFENRPYIFIDKESGEELKLHPNEVKENFVKQSTQFYNDIKLKCAQYKIDFVAADVNQPFDQLLLSYLIKRSKLK
jgi:uncharacterized protein (DUF58 family)